MRIVNRTKMRNIIEAMRKISKTFRTLLERTKSFTRSSMSIPSPKVADTNESLETSRRSAAASP
jgi:hypothetical protein